jgi:hypothetical protein
METLVGSNLKILIQAVMPTGITLASAGITLEFYTDPAGTKCVISKSDTDKLFSTEDGNYIAIVNTSGMTEGNLIMRANISVTDTINASTVTRNEIVRVTTGIKLYDEE